MARIDMNTVAAQAKLFKDYMRQFNDMFVGRNTQIQLITYALLMRQHVLLFGDPGTSKTAVCDAIFGGITGATKFMIEMSQFMSEDALFGAYDVKRMREDGVLEHRIDGMLPQAHLARIGEFLDANPAVLRSMLGAFNERRMMRGTQQLTLPLMTAYCDTNKNPTDYLRRNPDAWAVLDRILFLGKLDYLEDGKDLGEMVARFQHGQTKQPAMTIPIDVIMALSSLVVMPPGLIQDRNISDTFGNAVAEYRIARRKMPEEDKSHFILPDISDRRVAVSSQILEAEAVLNGRLEVRVDDIMAAGVILCTSAAEHQLWESIAEKHIAQARRVSAAMLKSSQGLALKGIGDQLEREVINAPATNKIANVSHTLQVLIQQFKSIAPTDDEIGAVHTALKQRLEEALTQVKERTLHESGLTGVDMEL